MKRFGAVWCALVLILGSVAQQGLSQTAGTAKMEVTINDYTGSSNDDHYTVVWITTEAGQFIKTLRKQGPSNWASSEWSSHCATWNTARAGSTVIDGYTSATARDYAGTNSPVIQHWNGRNASNNLMPDGNYKFWVQYAENAGQGPFTTTGLLWTKGPAGATNTYPNQGANFTSMKVTWTPVPATIPPTITSAAPTGNATLGVPYNFPCTASGTAPITFSAAGLPTGLTISSAGTITGIPTAAGTFTGTITAANGTSPNATQAFSITVNVVPASIGSVGLSGTNLILIGQGPANGVYSVLAAGNPAIAVGQWTALATRTFDASGQFRFTNAINPGVHQQYYRLRVP